MNTRFNPTANGSLHIGHIYMALLNEGMAHDSGGEFHVRFDDNTTHVMVAFLQRIPGGVWATREKAHLQLEDLTWMNIEIDRVSYQSEMEESVNKFLSTSHFRMVIDSVGYKYDSRPVIVPPSSSLGDFPLGTQHTVEKVVMDYWGGSDVLIRGMEWVAEQHLYAYFCALFGFRFPLCYYVQRLVTAQDANTCTRMEISKTIGNWSILELREMGIEPSQIRRELRDSCLVDPDGSWHVDNLKHQPRLVSRRIEDVLRR